MISAQTRSAFVARENATHFSGSCSRDSGFSPYGLPRNDVELRQPATWQSAAASVPRIRLLAHVRILVAVPYPAIVIIRIAIAELIAPSPCRGGGDASRNRPAPSPATSPPSPSS